MRPSIPLASLLLAHLAAGCADRVVGPAAPPGPTITVPGTDSSTGGGPGIPADSSTIVIIIKKRP